MKSKAITLIIITGVFILFLQIWFSVHASRDAGSDPLLKKKKKWNPDQDPLNISLKYTFLISYSDVPISQFYWTQNWDVNIICSDPDPHYTA